jgi:putative ABC transport system permease protein
MRAAAGWIGQTWRRWSRAPGWTLAVVATLALGIGATTAIFSAFDAIVLRPLPFPGSERIVALCETAPRVEGFCVASPPNVEDWARASRALDRFGVGRDWPFVLAAGGERTSVRGGIATGGLFELLGARAATGRLLADADLAPAANRVALLSWQLWTTRFGADPGVVGRAVEIDDRPVTVVGVLARESRLAGFESIELWMPLTATPDRVDNRAWRGFTALGRLAPGASLATARVEMRAIRERLATAHPAENGDWGLRLELLRQRLAGSLVATLRLLLAAVALLLAIAGVNVAHLLAAQAVRRESELALRAALGGGPGRLARQLLGESLALAAAGALGGVAIAAAATALLRPLLPPGIPRVEELGLDPRVLAFAVATTLAATLGFALPPAWRASRLEAGRALGSRRAGGPARRRASDLLVVGEVALALVLLAGAALLGRGVARLTAWDPGLPLDRLSPIWLSASPGRHPRGAQAVALFERVAEEVGALPGVEAAALGSAGPLFGGVETAEVAAAGAAGGAARARWFDVGPGYFAALGLPLVAGRDLGAGDDAGAPPVAVVNRALAARLWPGADPLGRRLEVEGRLLEVVGVAADVPPLRADRPVEAEIYWPKRQSPRWGTWLIVRRAAGAGSLDQALAARIASVAPDLSVGAPQPLDEQFARTLVRPRFALALVAAFAAVAAALAALGTHGVLAFRVAGRTREIGIRLALGATPRRVEAEIVRAGFRLALAGVAIGLLAALAAGRLTAGALYAVPASDPAALAAAAALLLAVALVACWIPARRASRVDPAVAARAE